MFDVAESLALVDARRVPGRTAGATSAADRSEFLIRDRDAKDGDLTDLLDAITRR